MSPYDDYLEVAAEWEAEFSRLKREYGEKISLVAQDTFLFNDTVAANIGYGLENATPEEVREAVRRFGDRLRRAARPAAGLRGRAPRARPPVQLLVVGLGTGDQPGGIQPSSLSSETDALGHVWSYAWSVGPTCTVTNPANASWVYSHDASLGLSTVTLRARATLIAK